MASDLEKARKIVADFLGNKDALSGDDMIPMVVEGLIVGRKEGLELLEQAIEEAIAKVGIKLTTKEVQDFQKPASKK